MAGALKSRLEFTLLLTIARVELSRSEQDLLRELLAGPLDWEYLLAMAVRHGLEPLLFHHLHQFGAEIIPQKFMQILREDCMAIAGRNLILAAKLQAVSAHLRARRIEHIAYKGPVLAEAYYGNCALRVFHDLDVIVPPSRLMDTRDALAEIGFSDKSGLSAAQQAVSFRFGFEHPFTSAEGLDLDLHWRVVQKFKSRSLDMAGTWQRVTTTRLFGCEIPTFCPEDMLVALCLHAGHHGWVQLSHLVDLAQLFLVHPRLDWDIVCSHLGDSNSNRIAYVCWHLLRQHWHVQIPEEMIARISADAHVARIAHRIETESWPSPSPVLTTSSLRWLLDRSAGEDATDRLRLLTGSIFCPAIEDFEMFRLPQILAPLYPGLRALRLACRYTLSWWHA
ncbi:MAG: nucleotidyltransferase family protein [Terracidiphilus sp.]